MPIKIDGTNGVLQAYDYQVLTTGFSYTFAAGTQTLIINPAGTLAAGTITMPASPADGMVITVTTTQQITALTLNGNTGQSVNTSTTFMSAGSALAYIYRLSSTTWFPIDSIPRLQNVPIGVDQTWQNVVGSRALGAPYTNSTGRPIMVSVSISGSPNNGAFYMTIGGVIIGYQGVQAVASAVMLATITAIVPPGAVYRADDYSGASLNTWAELR